jgi:superfamily II DNA or RNA helicase
MTASLRITETGFDYPFMDDYQSLISDLVCDQERNEIIVKDVMNQVNTETGIALVISDRKNHCKKLCELIETEGIETRLLTGAITNGKRKDIIEELDQGHVKVLVATGQLIGEGFDLKTLSSIFITTPIKFSGRVKQYIGRILRMADGKDKAIIYDYKDEPGILQYSFKNRLRAYGDLGVNCITYP